MAGSFRKILTGIRMLAAALLSAGLAGTAHSGELADFNAAVEAAQVHFRAASAYLRTGNVDLAAIELEEMADKWNAVISGFADNRPDAFDGNASYVPALSGTAAAIDAALAAIDAGDSDGARSTLAQIRARMSDMRAQSDIYLFADCIRDVNLAMRPLRAYRRARPDLADATAAARVIQAGAIYGHELARCDAKAPPHIAADEEFRRLMDTARASTARIPEAVISKDGGLFFRLLIELMSLDNLLFFRFG